MAISERKISKQTGYKQTEIGLIPEDWKVQPIGEAFDICNHLRYPISQEIRKKMSGEYPYYGPTKIQDYINEYRVEGEYALIGEDGDHFLKWQELPMTLLVNGKFNVNNHAHLVKGIKNLTSWFYYYFNNKDLTPYLTRQGAGRYKLTKNTLIMIPCPLPPLPEQQAIATALSDIDALIASLDKLIAKKRDIKQATTQELLTGKTRLPGFSGEWEVKNIGEIAEIDSDNLSSNTNPDYNFKYISLEDVDAGVLRGYSEISFRNAPSRARRKIKKNDVLVSTVRPNLKSHLYVKDDITDFICSTGFSVLRCYQPITDPRYVYFHLFANEVGRQIESLLGGSNYPAINSSDVKALQIPFPPLPEQQAIATILSDMDAEIVKLEQKRDKTRALKQGMMQELLTGKMRLYEHNRPGRAHDAESSGQSLQHATEL